jgi:very-short-patch-repair endonuclease
VATRAVEDTLEDASIFQSDLPIEAKLDRARMELLDLSARNRLLNMPRSGKSAKSVQVVDEKSAEIFRLLVTEGRVFTFLAGRISPEEGDPESEADLEEIAELAQPEDDELDERGRAARHVDTKLQTRLTSKGLQKRLLELFYDARTLEEEQGVNILYLALGSLKWMDPQNAANVRYAPILLVPVSLERGNAGEKFKLRVRAEEFASNLSLEAYLDRVHGIRLPAFEATDQFDFDSYVAGVAEAIAAKHGWEVLADDVTLGFFSFAKFLMYRDLDPASWPKGGGIGDRALIRGLLSDGFEAGEGMLPEDAKIDAFIPPADMLHIVDSDSSQALVVHEVRQGRDMVVQGPPGTGKSQTIANIIASAIADGKTVLFVAEKMAALEVVKRRLDTTGVGDACLELHSNKANKRAVLEELRRTWELGAPRGQDPGTLASRLLEARDQLNGHAARMHSPHASAGLTPFQVIGQLSRLRLEGERPNDVQLVGATEWSADGFAERRSVLAELAERVETIGKPSQHPWRGVGLASILPNDVERLTARLGDLLNQLIAVDGAQTDLAHTLRRNPAIQLTGTAALVELAERVATAPSLSSAALANDVWADRGGEISALLATGTKLGSIEAELSGTFLESAWTADLEEARAALDPLPASFSADAFKTIADVAKRLPAFLLAAEKLARAVGRDAPVSLAGAKRLVEVARRVADAPEANAEVFAADLWDSGVERAGDLAATVATFEGAREKVSGGLLESAWDVDLGAARTTLASHGTGFLRFFSGEWRSANRLVKSFLSRPDQPLKMTLSLLDSLSSGKAARREIEAEDTLGRTAFGHHWRGTRSASAPLVAIVEWMRSLKGLGAEPRLIAAQKPDTDLVTAAIAAAETELASITPLLFATRDALENLWADVFGDVPAIDHADLHAVLQKVVGISEADRVTASVLHAVPPTLQERRDLLDRLAEGRVLASIVDSALALGDLAFGPAWQGRNSDWATLAAGATWIAENDDIRILASEIEDRSEPASRARGIKADVSNVTRELRLLESDLVLDSQEAVGSSALEQATVAALIERMGLWRDSGEQISNWVAYRDRARTAAERGCGDLVDRLKDGRLTTSQIVPAFEMAYFEAVYADLVRAEPELGRFDGTLHGRLAREFAEMDRQRIAAAGVEVVRAHYRAVPPRDGGAVGPLGILRSEMQKRRGHMPIRRLMEKAGPAVQALKPVLMMSPLSVAQFLTPGAFEFDLLVMDEASQIQPVDALGAIARSKQVVVVGDPKQLPPTAFFAKMTGAGSEEEEDDGTRVADIESILGLFTARGLPTRMLRWHYRSKHQSLIAVSNRQFYESKLFIVPSPYTAEAGMGLRFHQVPQGIFDAGGTRTNQVEAKIVAEAIVAHARDCPDLSLGVAAFSAAQRRAILDHLEVLRRELPAEIENFFQAAHPSEPFFVKNLENVQGDERDVIFISVGYGPTMLGGRVPMRFGPLGTEGGERRLNVLISRAKQRCEVFSSMTDEDIDPDFASTRKGVFAFRMFLHYARTGRLTIAESTGRDHDSVFEEQVAKALQARGYQVHRQVGIAGFFIDLAVADEERPGRYLVGIECDGASYHDARSARDRDRLRQSVLESHGWTIHRIWSTDWFQRPNEQVELAIARIEAAKAEHDLAIEHRPKRAVPVEIVAVERDAVTEIGLQRAGEDETTVDDGYVEAVVTRPSHRLEELHETPTGILSELAEQVIGIEGPVHIDEIIDRIRDAWALKRAGTRIQSAIERAIDVSVRMQRVVKQGDFLSLPDQEVKVRDRSATRSPTLRRAEMLPPAELQVAAVRVVRENLGATRDQVVQAVSRALGIKSTSAQVKAAILDAVEAEVRDGRLAAQHDLLVIAS